MKSILVSFILLISALAHSQMSDSDILRACFRGPFQNKIWMDSPEPVFTNYIKSLGYDNIETLGITYRVCRDARLKSNITQNIIASGLNNSNAVNNYVTTLRSVINSITNACRPGADCRDSNIVFPLEGNSNDSSVCSRYDNFNLIVADINITACHRGAIKKIWIDRPAPGFVQELRSRWGYSLYKAMGIAYRICRGVDTSDSAATSTHVLNQILRECPANRACNLYVAPYLESSSNRNSNGVNSCSR